MAIVLRPRDDGVERAESPTHEAAADRRVGSCRVVPDRGRRSPDLVGGRRDRPRGAPPAGVPGARRDPTSWRRRERRRRLVPDATSSGGTSAMSDFLLLYLLDPLRTAAPRGAVVDGGGRLRGARVAGRGVASRGRRRSRASSASACSGCGTSRWRRSHRCSSRCDHDRVRDPAGIARARRATGSRRASSPILDAMQTMPAFVYLVPVLLLFGPGRVPAHHRVVHLRAAGRDPAHEPRHPAGAEGDRRGGRGLRVDLAAAAAEGPAAARRSRRSCSA